MEEEKNIEVKKNINAKTIMIMLGVLLIGIGCGFLISKVFDNKDNNTSNNDNNNVTDNKDNNVIDNNENKSIELDDEKLIVELSNKIDEIKRELVGQEKSKSKEEPYFTENGSKELDQLEVPPHNYCFDVSCINPRETVFQDTSIDLDHWNIKSKNEDTVILEKIFSYPSTDESNKILFSMSVTFKKENNLWKVDHFLETTERVQNSDTKENEQNDNKKENNNIENDQIEVIPVMDNFVFKHGSLYFIYNKDVYKYETVDNEETNKYGYTIFSLTHSKCIIDNSDGYCKGNSMYSTKAEKIEGLENVKRLKLLNRPMATDESFVVYAITEEGNIYSIESTTNGVKVTKFLGNNDIMDMFGTEGNSYDILLKDGTYKEYKWNLKEGSDFEWETSYEIKK